MSTASTRLSWQPTDTACEIEAGMAARALSLAACQRHGRTLQVLDKCSSRAATGAHLHQLLRGNLARARAALRLPQLIAAGREAPLLRGRRGRRRGRRPRGRQATRALRERRAPLFWSLLQRQEGLLTSR